MSPPDADGEKWHESAKDGDAIRPLLQDESGDNRCEGTTTETTREDNHTAMTFYTTGPNPWNSNTFSSF